MDVTFLYTGGCAHCQRARRTVERSLQGVRNLHLESTNVEEHPEAAERFGLSSCPGIVVDGTLEFVGVPGPDALRKAVNSTVRGSEPTFVRGYETRH